MPLAILWAGSLLAVVLGAPPALPSGTAHMLFCASGSIGFMPLVPPPGFESQFAVAVVEINSATKIDNLGVSDLTVTNGAGKTTKMKRVVEVEQFDEPGVAGPGYFAYYLNTDPAGHTSPWNGTLPAGDIRLRIRVALPEEPAASPAANTERCSVTIGPFTIDGRLDGRWPT